jgi:aspartyl-tRNA(Asn)/glutamyl-tRNA(Gln) amidotransferase subunit C
MKIDINTVNKLARLSKLEFNDAAKDKMIGDLNKMLVFIDKLNEIDTTGIEPLIYMTEEGLPLRDDNVSRLITQADALKNAPKKDSDYFKVPKVKVN